MDNPQNIWDGSLLKDLFKLKNRGLLLDLVIFLLNLFLMRELSARFFGLIKSSGAGSDFANLILFLFFLSLLFLAPAGAILKRWHFHHRLSLEAKNEDLNFMGGCLFNPILYFCLMVVVFATVNAFILQFLEAGGPETGETVFTTLILVGFVMIVAHTVIVYRYFSPPKKEPRSEFLRSSNSELLGDACFFLNMIFFQIIWNTLMSIAPDPVNSIGEFAARLFFIIFVALLVYFPPRIFYLYEDIHKRRTWISIFLANAPLIYKVMAGS